MIKSVLSNWFGLAVSGAISFVLTPILIHHLGSLYYGLWILSASLVDYYGLLDIGMRTALFRFVARFKGANEGAALTQTVVTALAITAGFGVLLVTLIPFVVVLLPNYFNVAGSAQKNFQWLIVLMGLSLAVTLPARVLGTYLCGLQRFDLYNLAAIVGSFLRAVFIVLVLRRGLGVVAVAMVTFLVAVLSLFFHAWLVKRVDPGLSPDWSQTSWTRTRELLSYGFYAFINVIGEYLRSYTDAVVIARVLTVVLVTPFSIATRLMEYFKSILSAIGGPLLGAMSELDAQSRDEDQRRYFLDSTRLMALISFFLASLLVLDGRTLIRLWVGQEFLASYPLVLILCVAYAVSLGQYPSQLVMFARAQHRPLAYLTLAEGLANLFFSIHWARQFGLMGVALGTAVPMLVAKILIQPWYALWALKLSPWEYVKDALARPVTVCGLFLGLCGVLQIPWGAGGFSMFIAAVTFQTAVFGLLSYRLCLRASERSFLWGAIRHTVLRSQRWEHGSVRTVGYAALERPQEGRQ